MWRKRAPGESLRDASYRYYMEHFCPADCGQEEGLPHLRNRLFVFILILIFPISVLVYIPSAVISFVTESRVVLLADTIAMVVLSFTVLSKHLSLRAKKYLFSAIFSILATLLLIFIGPSGPGAVILFATSILMTLFISRNSGLTAAMVNLALMLVTLLLVPMTGFTPPGIPSLSAIGTLVVTLNMFAFNLLTVFGLDGLIRELNNSLLKEKKSESEIMDLYVNLEKKINMRTLELAETNQKLTEEITLHEFSRKELEKTTVELENFFNLTPNLLCIGDPTGRLMKVNQACENLLGYKPEELLGRSILEFVHPEDIEPTMESLRILGRGEHVLNFISRFRKPDDSYCYLEWHAILHRDFIYAAASDITGHKRIEENLNRAKKEAENANLAKSEFLANMSHEIRTPMNAVLGYSELLGSSRLDPVQKEYVDSLKSSGKSLLRLINDILDISKIEAGRLELEYEFIDTVDFFTEFEKIFAFKIREKGIRYITILNPDLPRGIRVDESRLRQIVFNLLGNAIKFTSEGSIELRVYTRPAAAGSQEAERSELVDLFIEVEDTGIGISPQMQEQIFEPFVQERNYRYAGGTGLGLPISRRLVQLMNGTIRLQSELGKGSTFTVTIPQVESLRDFVAPLADTHFDPATIRFGKASLLIVDDVQHNRNYLIDALKETSIQTYEAENGAMGLELARNLKPDLIITDIRMPVMNGYELLGQIRKDESLKNIPVLAYSASVLNLQQDHVRSSPFAGILIKPVKLHDLYHQLMQHIPYEDVPAKREPATKTQAETIEVSELQALITSLETDFQDTWKGFAMRQPIGQIILFAESLIELGSKHHADAVIRYGEDLREAAENFNIESILTLLDRYTSMVARLREQQMPE